MKADIIITIFLGLGFLIMGVKYYELSIRYRKQKTSNHILEKKYRKLWRKHN